jgi:hypothetical protein
MPTGMPRLPRATMLPLDAENVYGDTKVALRWRLRTGHRQLDPRPPVRVVRMSAIGTKRTSLVAPRMSAFGGKADMPFCAAQVCF